MANEYVLKMDGRVLRRPFEVQCSGELEIQLDGAILASLNIATPRKLQDAFTLPDGSRVHLCSVDQKGSVYLSMRLSQLHLRATARIDAATGAAVPSFDAKGEFLPLVWTPPADMVLMFAAMVKPYDGSYYSDLCYLFAIAGKQAYQIPVPNLYNDCHLCLGGDGMFTGKTLSEVFERAYVNVKESPWNNHIIKDDSDLFKKSQELFRFNSTKDGFVSMLPDKHWAKLCRPMATEVVSYLVL